MLRLKSEVPDEFERVAKLVVLYTAANSKTEMMAKNSGMRKLIICEFKDSHQI